MEQLLVFLSSRRVIAAIVGVGIVLISSLSLAAADGNPADDLAAARQQVYAIYSSQLQALAEKCVTGKLPMQADFTRNWLPKRDPTMLYIFTLPANSAAPKSLVESSLAQKWWARFMELRRGEAEELFALAQTALKSKQYALAFELARETVRENPDHEAARRVLGDRKHGDQWVSSEAARRLDVGQVWSDDFGWLPANQLSHYQNGQRYYRENWINAAEDARLHSNIHNGWNVESEHYLVVTNYSLEEGVKLAKRLEMLYDVWRQVFVQYYAKPAQVEQWFTAAGSATRPSEPSAAEAAAKENTAGELSVASTAPMTPHKLHQVVYFHDKQQYVDALKPAQAQIEMSIGYYSDSARSAYFFASDDAYVGTLYHEGTHQLFRETPPATVDPGRKNNFWIVEAIACYMESLTEHRVLGNETYGSYITLGGENAGRIPAARKRLLDDNFYVPLRELAACGMSDLQHDSRLPAIYSQISGQAWFLMHADQSRYRGALMNYLIAIYTGHAGVDTLEKLTGEKFEQLDHQYREFLK
jgi:hypothetical protein